MKQAVNTVIRNELIAAGASRTEASELSLLAGSLSQFKNERVSPKSSWLQGLVAVRRRSLVFGFSAVAAMALIIIVGISVSAQSSLPGSKLYAVKLRTEDSVALVDPGFKKTMMMRRAQEVKALVGTHASPNLILATLEDYQSDVRTYKIMDPSVINYCRSQLRSAIPGAPEEIKAAIDKTIGTIQTT